MLDIVKISFLAIAIYSIIGCSTSGTKVVSSIDPVKGAELYGNLEKSEKGWVLTDISTSSIERNVELGSYRNIATKNYSHHCSRGIFGLTAGDCRSCTKSFFSHKNKECTANNRRMNTYSPTSDNWGNMFIWPFMLIFAPFSLFVDDNPDMYWFPIHVEGVYSQKKYAKAVNKAKMTDNFDKRFIKAYSKYIDLVARAKTPDLKINRAELLAKIESERATAQWSIEKHLKSNLENELSMRIIDHSGLANKKALTDTLNVRDLVVHKVKMPSLPSMKHTDLKVYQNESELIKSTVSKANSLTEFEQAVVLLESDLQQAKIANTKALKENKILAGPINAENEMVYHKYRPVTEKHIATLNLYEGKRYQSKLKGHTYNIKLPNNVKIKNKSLQGKPEVLLTIKSKDFQDVRPNNFAHFNKVMSIVYDGYNLMVTNKTSQFLTIDMISLYHKSDIVSVGGSNTKRYTEIPPRGTFTLPISAFNLWHLDDSYPKLTKRAAKNTNINFGFAAKYFVGENNTRKTLYKEKSYNLFKILTEKHSYL